MAKKPSLGRGFDLLIPKDLDTSLMKEDTSRVQQILIQDIKPNPDQPRRQFEQSALDELAVSIQQHGVLQPIIIVRHDSGYRIVAGERRWRAAQAAKLTHMPAIVRSLKELEEVELSLIENIQREDLTPLDQALSVYRLQHQFNLSLEQIAEKLGKAPSTLSNLTRLLQLPDTARQALSDGKISEGHARAILALKGQKSKQDELLRYILDNNWTVRQAEQFVVGAKKGTTSSSAKERTLSETSLTKDLAKKLSVPVKIRHTAKGGQLIMIFKDEAELNELVSKIGD
jgi:ParB family chromosome partitioning protein